MECLYVGQTEETVVLFPAALENHLYEVDNSESGHQPALVSTHIQHGLKFTH